MSNWPVISPDAEHEQDQLISTHRPVPVGPVPTYDINRNLIAPHLCKTTLPGAIARVSFILNHW